MAEHSDDQITPMPFPQDVPGYFALGDGPEKNEARRSFVLTMLCDDNGVLLREWRKEVLDLELYLKTGSLDEAKRPLLERVK